MKTGPTKTTEPPPPTTKYLLWGKYQIEVGGLAQWVEVLRGRGLFFVIHSHAMNIDLPGALRNDDEDPGFVSSSDDNLSEPGLT